MGSLVWVLNLWGMRLAAGAVLLATMAAAVALAPVFRQAEATRGKLDEVVAQQKAEQATIWEGL